ncbi:unnamed protein product [Linum tenue]|uniref:CCHC-type domain-containing protein n=4 Tax=Linum tenue TaxID=586396 RepID=A0AAV0N5R3_9ROSI|nr:unnamed protein product [Linum tenue]
MEPPSDSMEEEEATQEQVVNPNAWNTGSHKIFTAHSQVEEWYVAESDSEDVAAAMKEDDLDDEIPEDDDPLCPTIAYTAMEKQRWRREWRSALIVKVLGRTFAFPVISRRLEVLWAKCGSIQVSSLSFGFYAVRFTSQIDYETAAAGGPWMIGDFYITVRPWRKNFNPQMAEVASTMVWARFPGLPREFINKEAVERIAEKIGKPVRVDRATQTGDRGKYARVNIEVDLTKPLLSKFKIEGLTYYVEYEGLHRICTECGKYGHTKATCPKLFKEPAPAQPDSQVATDKEPTSTYGEWMVVQPRGRGAKRNNQGPTKVPSSNEHDTSLGVDKTQGSRFSILVDEDIAEKQGSHAAQDKEASQLGAAVETRTPNLGSPVTHEAGEQNPTSMHVDTGEGVTKAQEGEFGQGSSLKPSSSVPVEAEVVSTKELGSGKNGRLTDQPSKSAHGRQANQDKRFTLPKPKHNGPGPEKAKQVQANSKTGDSKKGAGSLSPSGHK